MATVRDRRDSLAETAAGLHPSVRQLADEVERGHRMQDILRDIEQSIGADASTAATLDQIAEGARRLFGSVLSAVVVRSSDAAGFDMVAAAPRSYDAGFDLPLRVPERLLSTVFRRGQELRIDDYQATPPETRSALFARLAMTALIAVPIRRGPDVVGCVVVASQERGARFSAGEQRALSCLADHAAIALAHGEVVEALARTVDTLETRARTDLLTGLLNRSGFFEALDRHLVTSGHTGGGPRSSLVFIDLDRFKSINDLHGHAVGDQVLVTVAERLAGVDGVRSAARLGGDEFVAILAGDEDDADRAGADLLAALADPIGAAGATFELTASIGIAPLDADLSASEVVTNADLAMMSAKLRGRARVARFDSRLRRDMARRSAREWGLASAIADDEFVVRYQPIVHLATMQVVGIESLVRWDHPVEGVLGAEQFLPIAEELGLVGRIDELILRRSLREIADVRAALPAHERLAMSVNVSPVSLADSSLPDRILAALEDAGCSPSLLEVEVTETGVLDGRAGARSVQRIHDLGVRICVDDFGTGWSSLRRLRTLPVERLKLDRDFVSGICHERADRAIVSGVIELARELGLELVAEGVESSEQLDLLQRLGCELGQGYLLGPPMSVDELMVHLHATAAPRVGTI